MISIAIATYNGARFLREQLDSLYTQTLLPDEVVVCDDCSTDETTTILKEYQLKHGLKYIINKESLGCNRNFIKALSNCAGDYICICDQDDIWLPNKIETLYNKIISLNQGMPLCVSSLRFDIDAQGNLIGGKSYPETKGWRATLLSYGRSQGCTMIMNRRLKDIVIETATNYPELAYQMYYDELIAYTAITLGEKINLSEKLMKYRHHDKNTVDPFVGKLSFREKVKRVPTFYGFTIDERLKPICIIRQLFYNDIKDDSLVAFLDNVNEMMTKKNVWNKLACLLRNKQLPIMSRFEIAVKSTISICLKKIYKYPTA